MKEAGLRDDINYRGQRNNDINQIYRKAGLYYV